MIPIWVKQFRVELVTGLIVSASTFLLAWSILGLTAKFSDLVVAGVLSFIPGAVIGAIVGLVNELYQKLVEANRIFIEVSMTLEFQKEIHKLTWEFQKQIQSIMNDYPEKHKHLLERLISTSADKINQIPDVNAVQFYTWLMRALTSCTAWEGIHQGSIKLLGRNAEEGIDPDRYQLYQDGNQPSEDWYKNISRRYFETLSKAAADKRVVARRIIILSEEDKKDLRDPVVMESFWNATGSEVKSYWTDEIKIKKDLPAMLRLEDAALHDNELFLQYDRDRGVVQFLSLRSTPVTTNPKYINTPQALVQFLFWDLDQQLAGEMSQFRYTELTEEYIKHMTRWEGNKTEIQTHTAAQ